MRFAKPRSPVIENVELRPLLVDAAASARAVEGSADIRVPDTAAIVRADREMVRGALLNLLVNARQSGSTEPIEIGVTEEHGTCRVDVLDRGASFGDTDPERLFEAFHTTKKSGTGLGLAIVRRLVSLQGGTVTLARRDGGGTVASVILPAAPSAT
jgi:signal transduction histidine kinase